MKRVLIITYYWPPSGGAGVQRWLKFVKYLRDFGWEPIVYTPSNPEYSITDLTLNADIPANIEVITTPIWEPYQLYKTFTGKNSQEKIQPGLLISNKKGKWLETFSIWIRGNLFIPDARKFWIKPSIRFLSQYLKSHPVDLIVSTGPPHSMHLIALGIKKRFHIPWLADFRDPWTDIDFYNDLKLSTFAHKKHQQLELQTINGCDQMVVVSQEMKENYQKMGAQSVHLITNGFDSDDLSNDQPIPDTRFSIAHIGSLPPNRNPKILWMALAEMAEADPNFRNTLEIKLVGKVDQSILNELTRLKLHKNIKRIEYVPHDQVSQILRKSAVLLLAINNSPNAKGILTGKFFEYLAAQRPILAIGPSDGDLALILKETEAGEIADSNDIDHIKRIITNYFMKFQQHNLNNNPKGIEKYNRKNLTAQLARIMDQMTL